MDDSYSDDSELYMELRDMERTRKKSPRQRVSSSSSQLQQRSDLHEDSHHMMVALYYWRQQLCTKAFRAWRRSVPTRRSMREFTTPSSKVDDGHRSLRPRRAANSILRRHKESVKTHTKDDQDHPSSDESSVWAFRLSSTSHALRPPAPTTAAYVSNDPVVDRQRKAVTQAKRQQEVHRHKMHAIKTRYSLLDRTFSMWKDAVDSTRPDRVAALELAARHRRGKCLQSTWHHWGLWLHRKQRSKMAKVFAAQTVYEHVFRAWIYRTLVNRAGALVQLKRHAKLQIRHWHQWTLAYSTSQKWRVLVFYITSQRRQKNLRLLWRLWSVFVATHSQTRRHRQVATALCRAKTLTWSFKHWHSVSDVHLVEETHMRRKVAEGSAVKRWRAWTARRHQYWAMSHMALAWHDRQLAKASMRLWRRFLLLRAHRNHQRRRAAGFATAVLVGTAFGAWRSRARECCIERSQVKVAVAWCSSQTRQRSFHRWLEFVKRRGQQRLAVLHCYSITTERTFLRWRRWTEATGTARCRAMELADAKLFRHASDHFRAWQATAHRRHYVNMLRCRLQMRRSAATLRRHTEAWAAYVRPKTRRRHLCVAFQGQRVMRFLQQVLRQWQGVVEASHEWRQFVVRLDDTHSTKRLQYGFHQWRVHAAGVRVGAARACRLQDQVINLWSAWTHRRRSNRRQRQRAVQWHTTKMHERALTAWWMHVQMQRQARASAALIQATSSRHRVRDLWQTWRSRFRTAKQEHQATTLHNHQLLRRVWRGFQVALQLVAADNKRRRAAHMLVTGKLSSLTFGRWVQYVARQRHKRELNDLARELHACHQCTRAFQAWHRVHAKRQVQRKWRTQWVHVQLRSAVRQWHDLAQVRAGRTWTAVSSRRHYAVGVLRKVLYAWSDAAAFGRHVRATTAHAVNRVQICRLKQAVSRLQLHAASKQQSADALSRADAFYKQRRSSAAVARLRRHAVSAATRKHQRTVAKDVYRRHVERRVFYAMREVSRRSQYIRRMLVDALGMQASAKAKYMFGRWMTYMAKERVVHQAAQKTKGRALRRSIAQWHDTAVRERRCRDLMESTRTILFGNAVRSSMQAWIQFTTRRRRKGYCTDVATAHAVLKARQRAWAAWTVVHVRLGKLDRAVGRRRARHVRHLWSHWRNVVQSRRMQHAQIELATLHDAAKCMRKWLAAWRQATHDVQVENTAAVAKCQRQQQLRRSWRRWVHCKHDAAMLRRVTRMWSQRCIRACFRLWSMFRAHRLRKQHLAVQSHVHCRRRSVGGAFAHWKRLKTVRERKLQQHHAAASHDFRRVCKPCFVKWVACARKTKKTKHILAVAFRRDATMTMFRCFRGWQQHLRRVQATRQAARDYEGSMQGFYAVRAIETWRARAQELHKQRQLALRAMDFLERRLCGKCLDAWVLHGFLRQERALKVQIAIDHAAAVATRYRFDRWLDFTYLQYQTAQARHHHDAAVVHKAWTMWMAFMQSRVCTDEEVAMAEAHAKTQVRRRVWRRWRVFCVTQLQKRMAKFHYATTRLRLYFFTWKHNRDHMERLRHAWTYWEASSLKLRFQQWTRFIALCRVRHAQHRVFVGLQQRQAVRRWRRHTHTTKHDKRQVLWASQLFYESSVGWYFRAWRSKFQSQVHKRLQAERAVSHLIGKGLRGYFERWRATNSQQKQNREAKQMAALHLTVSRQRRAVRWLREHVQDHRHTQTIWRHVKAFFTDHAHRRFFAAWKTFVQERKTKLSLRRTAAIHFGGRTLRVIFAAWVAHVARTRFLKGRVYRSRHLYFSSLYSRSFFRLRRFATLKRRLRHVTDRVTRRRRQEWFDRWKQFREDVLIDKKRSARASMLYRKSHLKRLFSHWRSVAVERWMRQWLVNYAGVMRRQGSLALAVRRWWAATEAKKQVKAQGWRMREAHLVSTTMERWRHVSKSAKKGRALEAATNNRRQANAMHAWLHALVAADHAADEM